MGMKESETEYIYGGPWSSLSPSCIPESSGLDIDFHNKSQKENRRDANCVVKGNLLFARRFWRQRSLSLQI